MDIDISETLQIKDKETNRLENAAVKELLEILEARKMSNKSRNALDVNVDIMEVLWEEIIPQVINPATKPPLKIDKARSNKEVPFTKKVSLCSQRQQSFLKMFLGLN